MLKVFLVDDEPYILKGLTSTINWNEYGLEIAGQALNGEEALKCLEKGGVDILITDIAMPEMNGLKLIQNVKAIYPDTRYIVLSGYNDFEYVKEGIKLGIENYLLKPVNVSELVSTIETIVTKFNKPAHRDTFLEKDLEILKNNILYRWVTNSIDLMELKERAEILQIDLECSLYAVSAIRVLYDPDSKLSPEDPQRFHDISEVHGQIRSMLCKTTRIMCFCDFDNDIILIFGGDSPEPDKNKIMGVLEETCSKLRNTLGKSMLVTLSDLQYSFKSVHNCYTNAKKLLEYQLLHTDNQIIDNAYVRKLASTGSIHLEMDYQSFSMLLAKGKRSEVHSLIDNIYGKLTEQGNANPYDIINYSIEMIFYINRAVNEFENNGKSPVGDYKSMFSNLLKLQTIDQLIKYVKNLADYAIDSFISDTGRYSPIIRQVMNYINEHYNENLSLKSLSFVFNINTAYLGQLFQKETEELFTDYLNKIKMKKARQLLLDTNLKITDISREVGICNPNYFCTQFKKYMGISPSEIRVCKI